MMFHSFLKTTRRNLDADWLAERYEEQVPVGNFQIWKPSGFQECNVIIGWLRLEFFSLRASDYALIWEA